MVNDAEKLSPQGRALLDRRGFLRRSGMTLGGLSLAQLLAADELLADDPNPRTVSGTAPIRPAIAPDRPYAPRPPHFAAAAKQVLVIYCPGAVSHVDTFDYKPDLARFHGRKPPGIPATGR